MLQGDGGCGTHTIVTEGGERRWWGFLLETPCIGLHLAALSVAASLHRDFEPKRPISPPTVTCLIEGFGENALFQRDPGI